MHLSPGPRRIHQDADPLGVSNTLLSRLLWYSNWNSISSEKFRGPKQSHPRFIRVMRLEGEVFPTGFAGFAGYSARQAASDPRTNSLRSANRIAVIRITSRLGEMAFDLMSDDIFCRPDLRRARKSEVSGFQFEGYGRMPIVRFLGGAGATVSPFPQRTSKVGRAAAFQSPASELQKYLPLW